MNLKLLSFPIGIFLSFFRSFFRSFVLSFFRSFVLSFFHGRYVLFPVLLRAETGKCRSYVGTGLGIHDMEGTGRGETSVSGGLKGLWFAVE